MLRLVTIDLSKADIAAFEAYEAKVLSMVGRHGGRLEMRVRSMDGASETHLLFFPDEAAFQGFLNDPGRVALAPDWERSGARAEIALVERVGV